MTDQTLSEQADEYTVLARKYRPTSFEGLIGQEAMVRTLTNAIEQGRLAHAFILTGVRGVGKTTTARIIARVLNCIGEDGAGGPTATPCGVCEHCTAIAEDRHVDVLEMDAASRTGVDDIRELIEGVRYRPTSARYKVYIIDEVHMLSKNAFNALLKTLEEPPEHVKFIFATTEIRKIPVTVLSRCQRFDLRRVDTETLTSHFAGIAGKEGAQVNEGALSLIARAADGSVRDGLSLLDQAIAHGSGEVSEQQIRDMLGLADRSQTFMLLEAVLKGDIAPALALFEKLYVEGADPASVIEDLLDITHWLTRIKIVPSVADDPGVPEIERVSGKDMVERLSMAAIARAWQMLLKGLAEVRNAPSPVQAAEMVLVRLAYVTDLPTPADALKKMADNKDDTASQATASPPAASPPAAPAAIMPSPPPEQPPPSAPARDQVQALKQQPEFGPEPFPEAGTNDPENLQQVAELADEKREAILRANIINNVHLVHFEPGRVEVGLGEHGKRELPYEMAKFLSENTSRRWVVTVSNEAGAPTLQQQWDAAKASQRAQASEHPLVKAVLETFPGATIDDVQKN
ncbi:MAG: DNA polymerase III subunit gamma/tau [Rhodospirillaceae bacterium]|jgi:DNA polymerase III subunit gamma/tau|nr:DNA polymerase III subunit gamma/tau [Rhodospirillaceae bacterium]MBT5244924.1 DNA polymerase III subunit gamma/tau [Rhodospirillaceae bacterium]MBT5562685.1 DNA polymerase III subunit gamma/tau [Rhodospirillaceae bacterium]MBT6243005.1 DNA polymerase III subunit gamma/tau [Rhodospirillaceae bacterium]MBT7136852.1 DNA polymerase III subunit gamma/tau [Rhodospirillaceae bacterium]